MTYSHRNIAAEQKEACQKAKQVTDICKQLLITLAPLDWQNFRIRACVTVNGIEIADLLESVYILAPSKAYTSRKYPSRGCHTILGKAYANNDASRYIVDCNMVSLTSSISGKSSVKAAKD